MNSITSCQDIQTYLALPFLYYIIARLELISLILC
jgi:hypothetical protein